MSRVMMASDMSVNVPGAVNEPRLLIRIDVGPCADRLDDLIERYDGSPYWVNKLAGPDEQAPLICLYDEQFNGFGLQLVAVAKPRRVEAVIDTASANVMIDILGHGVQITPACTDNTRHRRAFAFAVE